MSWPQSILRARKRGTLSRAVSSAGPGDAKLYYRTRRLWLAIGGCRISRLEWRGKSSRPLSKSLTTALANENAPFGSQRLGNFAIFRANRNLRWLDCALHTDARRHFRHFLTRHPGILRRPQAHRSHQQQQV